ncbi:peptidase inhibitor family I36 protein [Streptomyces sp. NPDC002458]
MATSTGAHAASTDGSCPSANLCLWEDANFTGPRLISASTDTCIWVKPSHQFALSYISHLPVTAKLWYDHELLRTLPSGGFSSSFSSHIYFNYICTNGNTPY